MVDRWSRAKDALVTAAAAVADSGCCSDSPGPLAQAVPQVVDALCDDLNLARAVAALNEACARLADRPGVDPRSELESLLAIDGVLGVLGRNGRVGPAAAVSTPEFDASVDRLVAARDAARAARDWVESDRIRAELQSMGVVVVDRPGGSTWSRSPSA